MNKRRLIVIATAAASTALAVPSAAMASTGATPLAAGLVSPASSAAPAHSSPAATTHYRSQHHTAPEESGKVWPSGRVVVRNLPSATGHDPAARTPQVDAGTPGPRPGEQPRRTGLTNVQLKAAGAPVSSTRTARPSRGTVAPSTATSSSILFQDTLFPGAQGTAGVTPPDTQVAAGSSDVVEMVNSEMVITGKTGNHIKTTDLSTFFQAGTQTLPGGSTVNLPAVSDPKIVYNRFTQRFYATELVYDPSTNNSAVKLAVSQTADPTGAWLLYITHYEASTLMDQPKLGVSLDKIVITWNDYTGFGNSQSYTGTETYVTNQAEAENYGNAIPLDFFLYSDGTDKVFPVVNVDTGTTGPSDAYEAYFSKDIFGFSYITVITISGVPGDASGVSRSYSNDESIATTSSPPSVPQPGSTLKLDAGDDRIQSATFRGGLLWVAANDSCQPSGQPTLACSRVVLLANATSSSPTVAYDTDLYFNNTSLFYPAITMDDSNDIFLVASISSSSIYPSVIMASAQGGSTSVSGTMVRSGVGPMSCGCNTGSNLIRFGDYSGIGVDGSSASSVWIAGEYGNASSTSPSPVWGTEIGEYNY